MAQAGRQPFSEQELARSPTKQSLWDLESEMSRRVRSTLLEPRRPLCMRAARCFSAPLRRPTRGGGHFDRPAAGCGRLIEARAGYP